MIPKRKKDRGWDDDFDDEFFKELEDELENIGRIFEELKDKSVRESMREGHYVYGFSMRMGPDGKPSIEEFGNIPSILSGETDEPEDREPLTDVIEREGEVSIIVEIPGVGRDDIDLEIEESSIEIDVDVPKRSYHKMLELPCMVKPETAKASYNNGVLEVRIDRLENRKRDRGYRVRVK